MAILWETADGKFVKHGRENLKATFAALKEQSEPKILLYVHGGLVSAPAARAQASWLDETEQFGGLKSEGWETAYLVWRTGLFETVRINLHEIAGDRLFGLVERIIRRFFAEKTLSGMDGIARSMASKSFNGRTIEQMFEESEFREPEAIESNLTENELRLLEDDGEPGPGDPLYDLLAADPELLHLSDSIERAILFKDTKSFSLQPDQELALQSLSRLDAGVRQELESATHDSAKFIRRSFFKPVLWRAAKAGYRAIRRAIQRRDHGFHANGC